MNLRAAFLIAASCAAALAGCGGGTDEGTIAGASEAIVREASEGPVEATARLAKRDWTVGDAIDLEIEARAEAGVEVVMPDPGATLGPFTVRDARRPPDVPDGDRRRWTHRFTLETFDSGDLEIPAITISFTDRRSDEPVAGGVLLEPISLSVRSTIEQDADAGALLAMRDPADVVLPGERTTPWTLVIGLAVLAAALFSTAFWLVARLLRRAKGLPVEPPLAPHAWALRQLERLAAGGLLERGEMRSFYFRLTDIARGYVERRFDLAAPDQTTDEFLRAARTHPTLPARDQERLGKFLRGADLVKFARFEPSRADGEAAFLLARSFVEETAPVESGLGATAAAALREEVAA